ncbi:hypothetical protein RDI58_022265 [Solanum bulbocastanum]|uniref:Uncharacterized protein n=1 Tax=Solanum bulbocastanum TaxID=147425 RepID=A0AAN8TA87_SOLBU
MWRYHRMTHI